MGAYSAGGAWRWKFSRRKLNRLDCCFGRPFIDQRKNFSSSPLQVEEAHALLAGKHGRDVSTGVILEEALTLLLKKKSPKKREERRNAHLKKEFLKTTTTKEGIPSSRQPGKKTSQSTPGVSGQAKRRAKIARTLPQKLRDKILARDGFQCTFVGADGTRCQEKTCLEVDHIDPRSLGGSDEEWNLRVVCKCHNLLLAERKIGPAVMKRYYSNSAPGRST